MLKEKEWEWQEGIRIFKPDFLFGHACLILSWYFWLENIFLSFLPNSVIDFLSFLVYKDGDACGI